MSAWFQAHEWHVAMRVSAQVIDLAVARDMREADQPVWRVVKGECRGCSAGGVSVQHLECPLDASECPSCGKMLWAVTHYEIDGEWAPRFEVVG